MRLKNGGVKMRVKIINHLYKILSGKYDMKGDRFWDRILYMRMYFIHCKNDFAKLFLKINKI